MTKNVSKQHLRCNRISPGEVLISACAVTTSSTSEANLISAWALPKQNSNILTYFFDHSATADAATKSLPSMIPSPSNNNATTVGEYCQAVAYCHRRGRALP